MRKKQLTYLIVGILFLGFAGLALGQAKSGNIYGRVVAEDGSALPGATVTLSGHGAPQTFTTDSRGEYRFLNLDPANTYLLKFELSGFSTVERKDVDVNTGVNTDLRVVMRLAKVEAAITVTGETPLLDTRKVGTGAVISRVEMDSIPSARDPWVMVQTVPGVQVDRVNTGGNQSGQQTIFVAKGAQTSQGSWNLDGVTVSDMASGASSPTYWDFDSFQEIQAITGGSDPSIATAGVTLNMVTKRGTNDLHGSARVFITDQKFQDDPEFDSEMKRQRAAAGGTAAFTGNKIQAIQDYGAEVGGPLIQDRAWLWGAYARQQIDLVQVNGLFDKTTLEDVNGKLNVQIIESNALTSYFLRGDKIKFGRNAGPQRPQPTTWDQKGPTSLYKVEDSHVFSSSLFANLQYSYLDEAFQLVAQGGTGPQVYFDSQGIPQNSYISSFFRRPQHQLLGNASYFFNTGSVGHELKLGASYRTAPVANKGIWPGQGILAFEVGSGSCTTAFPKCAAITRQSNRKVAVDYTNVYLSDTIKADRLTISAGLRYDYQTGDIHKSTAPASPAFPDTLPSATAAAREDVVTWEDISPRLGATYAIGKERKTLARFSYARYANQLGAYPGNQLSAIPGVAYAYYPWNDANNNRRVDPGELDFTNRFRTINFNPANPSAAVSPHAIDGNLEAQKTDEIVIGIDRELMANFAVGAAYTYRKYDDFYHSVRRDPVTGRVVTAADYRFDHNATGTLPNGSPFSVPVYSLGPPPVPSASFFTNRRNYTQTFNGAELTLTKRLSSGWMARGSLAWNNAKQQIGRDGCPGFDPTNSQYSSGEDFVPGGCDDGGLVAPNAGGGSGGFGNVNLNSTWQASLTGLYQLPLGFNIAGTYFIREGYPIAYYFTDTGSQDRLTRRVYVTDVDKFRYDDVSQLDLRVDKVLNITSQVSMTLSAEMFNVLNENTVLQRNSRLGLSSQVTGSNTIFEIQSPRVIRFGGKISF